jgi:type 1 glutamine amidotransferase
MNDALDVLVVTGGHPFEAEPFFAVFDSIGAITWTNATAPATGHDVVVFYDIAGLRFTRSDPPTDAPAPTAEQRATYQALMDDGTGLVFLHHAIASWPAWPEFAEIVGGRYHYQPGRLRGVDYPDSGYVFDVTHIVDVLDPEHPVCAGLGDSFTLTDELYCCPVFEDSVVPLLRTRFDTGDPSAFSGTDLALRGRRNSNEGWTHPPGSDLVGWVKHAGRSPVVYLQFGDGPVTYADPVFRRVVANAIRWAASPDARRWAVARSQAAGAQPTPAEGAA